MPGEIVPDETLRDKSREWGEAEYLAAFEHLHHLQGKVFDTPNLQPTAELTSARRLTNESSTTSEQVFLNLSALSSTLMPRLKTSTDHLSGLPHLRSRP